MENNNQRLKFNKDVKFFDVDNIPIIGNFGNRTVIGLDKDGINLISRVESDGIEAEPDNLTEKEQILFDALKENGYFDPDKPKKISSAYVHVTDNCNLHCVGCYSFKENRNDKKDLPTDEIKRILKILVDNGVWTIVISGGEPFLRDDLSEILKYAKETLKIKQLSIISNGTMPLEKYEKCIPYLDRISISVDGYNNDTRFIRDPGIMPKVFETVKYLKGKIEVAMIATLHKKTSPIIDKYADLSKNMDVPLSFSILTLDYSNPIFKDYILGEEDFHNMNNYIMNNNDVVVNDSMVGHVGISANKGCGAGKSLISIGADGAIYPCQMMHCDELILGNILTDDIQEVLSSDKNICKDVYVDDFFECRDCKYKYICGGGCRASSYYKYKDVLHPEIGCKQAKKLFEEIVNKTKETFNIE